MRPSSKEAGLCGSCPAFYSEDAGDVHAFASKISDKCFSSLIVSDGANGKDASAEGRKIIGSVGPAAGGEMRFAMAKDQNGGFARDTGNLAKLILICDKISKENDGLRRELFDIVC